MKKLLKPLVLGFIFVTASIFMSCSDAIQETEEIQSIEQTEEKSEVGSERCGFSSHGGRTGGNSISDNSSNHRHNGHGHGSSVCK